MIPDDDRARWLHEPRHRSTLDPTRARPEPWFAGSGRGLMIAVLGVCAVLIVVRIASLWWMAEAAWDWWEHRPPARAGSGSPAPPAPPPVITSAAATLRRAAAPIGDEAMWIAADDYPPASIREEEEGKTRLIWTIDTDGRVRDCHAIEGKEHPRLVAAGCAALTVRARYTPALDERGRKVATTRTRNVVWRLPE